MSGIEMFQELNPDLVLLDFGMPDMNGIEAASKMYTANPTVPLILFTVWDIDGFERAGRQGGHLRGGAQERGLEADRKN